MHIMAGPTLTQDKSTRRTQPDPYWKVVVRSGDIITYHRFNDEAAALKFKKSVESK